MLAYIVAALGVVIVLMGGAVMGFPGAMREVAAMVKAPKVLYGVIASRIVTGAFLVFASSTCSWPLAIGTIGILALAAGFAGLFIGTQRLQALIAWVLRLPDGALRGGAVAAVIMGAFVVYAAIL